MHLIDAVAACGRFVVQCAAALIVGLTPAHAQSARSYVYNGPLLPLLLQMPGKGWAQGSAKASIFIVVGYIKCTTLV